MWRDLKMKTINSPNGLLSAAVVALLLAATAGGCGNDGDEAAQTSTSTTQVSTEIPATDKGQVKKVLGDLQASYIAPDGGSTFCGLLTSAGQREVVNFGREQMGLSGTCPEMINEMSSRSRAAGLKQKVARLVTVRVSGDRATGLIKDAQRAPVPTRFVKIDGEWKMVSPGFTQAVTPQTGNGK
jgi:hypothetical protein